MEIKDSSFYDSKITKLVPDQSIRLVTTPKCNFTCEWCHEEGQAKNHIESINFKEVTQPNIKAIIKELFPNPDGKVDIHLTGGEPSMHPEINDIIEEIVSMGHVPKMTSNGAYDSDRLRDMTDHGLTSVNFSIHSLSPKEFLETQRHSNIRLAERQVKLATKNALLAREIEGFKSSINTVICGKKDIPRLYEVAKFALENKLKLRIIKSLETREEARKALVEWYKSIGAEYLGTKMSMNTACTSHDISGKINKKRLDFKEKDLRPLRVEAVCRDCKDKCYESIYGVRYSENKFGGIVTTCIDRKDGKATMSVDDFLESDQLQGLKYATFSN